MYLFIPEHMHKKPTKLEEDCTVIKFVKVQKKC